MCTKSLYTLFLMLFSFWLTPAAEAQHPSETYPVDGVTHRDFPHFRIAALIGHTYIPAVDVGEHYFIPSWGLDLEYWLGERFAVGMHNDIEVATFVIEQDHEMALERDYPLVLTFDMILKPFGNWVFQIGPGYEFERNENFFLFRLGAEYEVEFGHHWDLFPSIFYDSRLNANDTWTIAFGIGKRF